MPARGKGVWRARRRLPQVCVPVFVGGQRISRLEGALFVTAYVAHLTLLILTRSS
ncbi:hypothetical protein [Devosia sp.]|uniref:hypothetical protein n=1 Tax=Devosia sp. TaxID=1871048 RepID=UPI002EE2346A